MDEKESEILLKYYREELKKTTDERERKRLRFYIDLLQFKENPEPPKEKFRLRLIQGGKSNDPNG